MDRGDENFRHGREDGHDPEDPFTHLDLSAVIEQLTAPFADVVLSQGFENKLSQRLSIPRLIMKGLQNSEDPMEEVRKLENAARLEVATRDFRTAVSIYSAEKYPKTSLEILFDDKDDLVEKLTQKSDASKLMFARTGNTWQYEKLYEPYEHKGVEAVGISLETNPLDHSSEARLRMVVHPEITARGSSDSIVSMLLNHKEFGRLVFGYKFGEEAAEPYAVRHGSGRGVVINKEEGERIILELKSNVLTVTHTIKKETKKLEASKKEEVTDEDKASEEKEQLELFKSRVSSQLDFVKKQFPAFVEHIAEFWDKSLPEEHLTVKAGGKLGDLGLFDSMDEQKDIDSKDIPDCVTDRRQKELFVQTSRPNPKTTFEMVGGLEGEVKRVKQAISKAMHPERYEAVGFDPRATVLLIGPPGTGKTMMAEAVASEVDGIFLAAKGSDVMSMWAGEAEKNVAGLFDLVEVLSKERKVVLFFDEIEAVAPSRSGQHMMEHERKVTAEFLSALNRRYPNAIIIGATNAPANCDQAVTRPGRFTDIIKVGNPDKEGRRHIINNWIEYYRGRASIEIFNGVQIEELADATEGLNGADLRTIIESAIVNEVESALEDEREFIALGNTALMAHVETHVETTSERFANYLGTPHESFGPQPIILVREA